MKHRIVLIAHLLLFLLFAVVRMAAQSYQTTGVVHDRTGALIPGAAVTVRSPASVLVSSSVTDEQGRFYFALPAAATYQVEIRASGFTPYQTEIIVTSDAPSANLNIALAVEGNSQTVEVTADALVAETTSTQLGEILDTKKIEGVPLNGRNFTDLMAVQPGIVPQNTAQPGAVIMTGVASTPPSGDANPGNLSISGQRESSNGFRVNGSDVEEDVNMGTSIVPNLDAIDSFQVLTSNFDAEYGNSSGGQVLVVTKAGTAHLHGSLFEFSRNTALDARNYFSQDRAAYRQNQFGGTLGGAPFGSKSLTFFADFQGTRLTEGIDTGNIAVPSLAERSGDFSANPLTGSVNGNYWASVLSASVGRLPPANHISRSFLMAEYPNSPGLHPPDTFWHPFPCPTSAHRSSPPPRRPNRYRTTRARCARIGPTAKKRSPLTTSSMNILSTIHIRLARAAQAYQASMPPQTDARSWRA